MKENSSKETLRRESGVPLPYIRPRRLRADAATRALVRETRLTPDMLILPVFVKEGGDAEDIAAMPGVQRHSLSSLLSLAEEALSLGIRALAPFPVVGDEKRDSEASEAWNEKGIIPQALALLKSRLPELLLIADVALDPYTTHGHDGLLDERGEVDNDRTLAVLARQALVLAQAGAEVVAPSDMMDGRVRAIRLALDDAGLTGKRILAYSAKYASAFYGPFRQALGSAQALGSSGKETYQMDPANAREALREAALDVEEGADMLMVKPAMPYLDVIAMLSSHFSQPVFAYQVSGEYAMTKLAAKAQVMDEKKAMMESLVGIVRAGARSVLTYFALDAARALLGR